MCHSTLGLKILIFPRIRSSLHTKPTIKTLFLLTVLIQLIYSIYSYLYYIVSIKKSLKTPKGFLEAINQRSIVCKFPRESGHTMIQG